MFEEDLSAFMADADLVKLIEAVKVSDDMLDVVELSENQHSDMLAWCLNPSEGHAQGDAVLKDLLIAAFMKGADCTYDNKKFFAEWTPARIRRSSFSSAFVSREFQISLEELKRGRLDLFVVDPQNKVLVVIENKVGASLTARQLGAYCQRAKDDIGARRAFQEFSFVFIVLDRELDGYTEEKIKELGTRWCLLDYSWLEASAERARHHMARHNQAAHLLMSYCQKQTAWESAADHEISSLAADLAIRHEPVITALREFRKNKIIDWTPAVWSTAEGDLRVFEQQNHHLCMLLLQASGIAAVRVGLMKALKQLDLAGVDQRRTWIGVATGPLRELYGDEDGHAPWPLFVNIFRERGSESEPSKFTVRVVWCRSSFKSGVDLDSLRAKLATVFPDIQRFEAFNRRRVVISRGATVAAAVRDAARAVEKIEGVLEGF